MPMGIRQRGDYQFASSRDSDGDTNVSAFHEGNLVGTLQATPQKHTPNVWGGKFETHAAYQHGPQGELFRTMPGRLDMLAVSPQHQGQGLGRGMVNVALNRVGTARPSSELTPDSAGLLGHMGIPHAEASVMKDKARRDSWGEQLLWDRERKLEGTWPGVVADSGEGDTLRDDTATAHTPPSFLAGTNAPASRPSRSAPQKETLF